MPESLMTKPTPASQPCRLCKTLCIEAKQGYDTLIQTVQRSPAIIAQTCMVCLVVVSWESYAVEDNLGFKVQGLMQHSPWLPGMAKAFGPPYSLSAATEAPLLALGLRPTGRPMPPSRVAGAGGPKAGGRSGLCTTRRPGQMEMVQIRRKHAGHAGATTNTTHAHSALRNSCAVQGQSPIHHEANCVPTKEHVRHAAANTNTTHAHNALQVSCAFQGQNLMHHQE